MSDNYSSYLAFYNSSNNLVSMNEVKNGIVYFPESANYVRTFMWKGINTLSPLMMSRFFNMGTIVSSVKVLYPGFTDKAVTFSYDDGPVESDTTLVSIFNKYNLKCTFNITREEPNYRSMYEGHEVASHSKGHINMFADAEPFATTQKCIDSITEGKALVESIFGEGSCKGFVWPYGMPNTRDDYSELLKTIKDNYKYCRNTLSTFGFSLPNNWYNWTPTCKHTDMHRLLPEFLADDSDGLKLFYIWGHAYEFTPKYNGDWLQ